ncbi:LysR substrate-binding domain-containing protein [Geodermatophilus sp. SYSU D00697]
MAELDLNLVRTLVSVYETGNLTRTAQALQVTQPTVSHALSRLRHHFGDPLFVRGRSGMEPTAVAAELYAGFRTALRGIDLTVESTRRFDPATATRRFRICLTDVGEMSLLPRILEQLAREAPSAELEVVPMDFERVAEWLTAGRVDAAIASTPVPGDLRSTVVLEDSYGCLVREDFPLVDGRMTLADFLAGRHAVVAANTGHRLAERILADLQLDRRTTVTVPHFSALPHLVDRCNLIAIFPVHAGHTVLGGRPLVVVEPPFPIPTFEVRLYWQARHRESAAQLWFRRVILTALRSGSGTPAPAAARA